MSTNNFSIEAILLERANLEELERLIGALELHEALKRSDIVDVVVKGAPQNLQEESTRVAKRFAMLNYPPKLVAHPDKGQCAVQVSADALRAFVDNRRRESR